MPKGGFALVLKVHHAAIDGKSGVEMITAIHSQSAEVVDPPPPGHAVGAGAGPVAVLELYGRASINALRTPARTARLVGRLVPGVGRAAAVQRANPRPSSSGMAPGTRFNGPVTAHRVLDARFFDVRRAQADPRQVPGATVNDVALAVIGGAMRSLPGEASASCPARSLRAMTPVSVRTEAEKGDLGNQVSAMVVSLATDIADPVERLAAVHRSTAGSKEVTQAIGARNLAELSQLAPGRAHRPGHAAGRAVRPAGQRRRGQHASSPTCPARASRCTSPAPGRCARSVPVRWSTAWA